MANTFVKISSITVGAGGASSVSFSSIPDTYTDLFIKASVRTNRPNPNDALSIKLNGSTTGYASKSLTYDNGGIASYNNLFNAGYVINTDGDSLTANIFSNQEVYIPNYTSSNNKCISSNTATENNGQDARVEIMTNFWSNSSAVTSITLDSYTGNTLLQHSTFTLYGIKNS